jgi:ketosteroid isomerase-like protein
MKQTAVTFLLLCLTQVASGQLQAQPCDQRPADRDAIRAHIGSIFQAFIDHDGAKLRATHAPEWRGFLEGSQKEISGIESYMQAVEGSTRPSPNGMKSYKMVEFDCVLYGDTAIVPFVAEVHGVWDGQPWDSTLRIVDFYTKLAGSWIQAGSDTQVHPRELNARQSRSQPLPAFMKKQLLDVREHVWRAYFNNERAFLEQVLPADLIAIDPGEGDWSTRDSILKGAERFAQSGGKLTKLQFPRTEMQTYGNVVQIYSTYQMEFDGAHGPTQQSGRATETFVLRDEQWVNVGWHMDAERGNDHGSSSSGTGSTANPMR